MNKNKKIVIIGGGPKAIAIAAKAHVLKQLGYTVPEVIIIEKYEVGANWSGKYGYTDGKGILNISPLKDIGYPYQSKFEKKVDTLMDEYSFVNFLKNQNQYTAWVDGWSLPITHKDLYSYLNWAAQKLNITPLIGEVFYLKPIEDAWEVTYRTKSSKKTTLICDGVVVTGPGKVNETLTIPKASNLYNAKDFWTQINQFKDISNERLAFIGGGISGGSIFERLMPQLDNTSHLDWFTRRGVFTRSENFINNQFFSDADEWSELPENVREQFVKHTDRGSIDITTHEVMYRYNKNFTLVVGDPAEIIKERNGKLRILYASTHGNLQKTYDKVIIATGFDNLYFLSWLPKQIKKKYKLDLSEAEFSKKLKKDLCLTELPTLHLPMLAWFKYGIGLSVLSCLSTLSDRILETYVKK